MHKKKNHLKPFKPNNEFSILLGSIREEKPRHAFYELRPDRILNSRKDNRNFVTGRPVSLSSVTGGSPATHLRRRQDSDGLVQTFLPAKDTPTETYRNKMLKSTVVYIICWYNLLENSHWKIDLFRLSSR